MSGEYVFCRYNKLRFFAKNDTVVVLRELNVGTQTHIAFRVLVVYSIIYGLIPIWSDIPSILISFWSDIVSFWSDIEYQTKIESFFPIWSDTTKHYYFLLKKQIGLIIGLFFSDWSDILQQVSNWYGQVLFLSVDVF